jgi:hypothetical protein
MEQRHHTIRLQRTKYSGAEQPATGARAPMSTTDYIIILVIILTVACVCSFFIGYYRGAMMAKKIGLKAMDELSEHALETMRNLRNP